MTRKEILLNSIEGKSTLRLPYVPFAGVHAGLLTGYNATEVLTDPEKLFQSLIKVNQLYSPDGMPIVFDLQLEAEVLGCELKWADFSPPSVKTHPLADTMEIPCMCKIPKKQDGRFPIVLDVMQRMKEAVGNEIALIGLVCGPLTLSSHLRGNQIFMDMFDDPGYVKNLIDFSTTVAKTVGSYYAETGMDIIGVVDPLVSQISPEYFVEFLSDSYAQLFQYITDMDVVSAFFVCGNATNNIEVMCKAFPKAIFVDENVNMNTAKKITDRYKIALGGNIPLTSVMLHGNQYDNMKYVVDLADSLSHSQLVIAPGCDMPYHVPVENAIAVSHAVRNIEETRSMVKNYTAVEENIEVELPNYSNLEKPLIEVFTLDSLTCAACTYMMDAANIAKEHYGSTIDVVEYKFTDKENIARVKKMGVKQLPSIYINGELKYSSIIPSRKALFAEIDYALSQMDKKSFGN